MYAKELPQTSYSFWERTDNKILKGNCISCFIGKTSDDSYNGKEIATCPWGEKNPISCADFGCVVGTSKDADCEWRNPHLFTWGLNHEICKKCCCPEGSDKCKEDVDHMEDEEDNNRA